MLQVLVIGITVPLMSVGTPPQVTGFFLLFSYEHSQVTISCSVQRPVTTFFAGLSTSIKFISHVNKLSFISI